MRAQDPSDPKEKKPASYVAQETAQVTSENNATTSLAGEQPASTPPEAGKNAPEPENAEHKSDITGKHVDEYFSKDNEEQFL